MLAQRVQQWGKQAWRAEGLAEGLAEGRAEGRAEGPAAKGLNNERSTLLPAGSPALRCGNGGTPWRAAGAGGTTRRN